MESVTLSVKTPKGWNTVGVFYTAEDAEAWIERVLKGRIRLQYQHEKVFKIG